jgi:Tol biopolymer transport system component
MRIAIRHGFHFAFAALAVACSEKHPSTPADPIVTAADPPAGTVVSDASLNQQQIVSANSSANVAWVSVAPGTYAAAVSAAVVNNSRTVHPVSTPVIEGGFDPVAIEAEPDDELTLTLTRPSASPISFAVKVPRKRPPEIVRTLPARGRTDVATNVQIVIVFSEPLENSDRTRAAFKLTSDWQPVAGNAQLTADGLKVVFSPDRELEPLKSYTLSVDPSLHDRDGDPLQEGTTISFITASSGNVPGELSRPQGIITFIGWSGMEWHDDIFSINLDGSGLVNLTRHPRRDFDPVWSPDGSKIAFLSARAPGSRIQYFWNVPVENDLYVMDADGSNVRRLTTTGGAHKPSWSPDGTKLAFADNTGSFVEPSGARSDIAIIEIASGEPSRRYLGVRAPYQTPYGEDEGGMTPINVAWSPDGTRIAFSSWRDIDYMDLWIVGADGSGLTRILTGSDDVSAPEPYPASFDFPSWSPDGRRIALHTVTGSWLSYRISGSLAIVNADGSGFERIAAPEGASRPTGVTSWSPDGKSIAYSAGDGIRYVNVDGSGGGLIVPGTNPSWRASR